MKSAFAITSYANADQLPDFFKPQLSSSVEEEESHRLQRAVARMRADTESQELSTELGVNTAVNKCASLRASLRSWPDPTAGKVTVTLLFFSPLLGYLRATFRRDNADEANTMNWAFLECEVTSLSSVAPLHGCRDSAFDASMKISSFLSKLILSISFF